MPVGSLLPGFFLSGIGVGPALFFDHHMEQIKALGPASCIGDNSMGDLQ